jgi:hypothetical protein
MGNLYVASGEPRIYKFLPDGRSTIFADTAVFDPNEGPVGLTFDPFDNLFVTTESANMASDRVLMFAPDGTKTTVATGLSNARGLAFDSTGNLFVAEIRQTTTGDILKIDPNGMITTFASGLGRPQGNGGPEYVTFQPFPVIKGNPSATATDGSPFIYQITATNHPTSYDATGLPSGLNIDPSSGIISGAPTMTGDFQIPISASNIFGNGSNSLHLIVDPKTMGPEIISATAATGRTGQMFRFQVLTTNTTPDAVLSTSPLPPGLSANATTGLISGTPTSNGTFNIALTITDGAESAAGMLQLTFTSDPAIPIITSGDTASLVPGLFFSYTLTADADGNFSYIGIDGQLNGALPPNLGYDAPSHTISGFYMPSGNVMPVRQKVREASHQGDRPETIRIRPPGVGTCQMIVSNENGTGTSPVNFYAGFFVNLRAAPSSRNGDVTGTYNPDLSVTVMATPAPSYGFVNWTNEDGSVASTSADYTFTPTSDRTLTANFVVTGPTPTPPPSSTPKPHGTPGATPRPSATPK